MIATGSATRRSVTGGTVVLSWLALGLALIACVVALVRLAAQAGVALSFPYAFDYGEGVVWQQMRDIVAGQAYRPIGTYPAIAYEYPPLYHLCVAAVAAMTGIDPLYAGRLVSLASALACVVAIGWLTCHAIAGESRVTRRGAATVAALAFATLPVVGMWALLMRIDLLACAFTLAGMVLASRAPRSAGASIAAGFVFTLALYTRQTCLPAPAAAFVVLLIVCPRRAWAMAGASLASGLAALIALEVATGGGFLLNIVFYNVNRVIWDHATALLMVLLSYTAVIATALVGAHAAVRVMALDHWRDVRSRLTGAPHHVVLGIVLLTLAVKTLTLPAILKSGASDNYLIDWFSGLATLVGVASVPLLRAAQRLPAAPPALLLALFGIGLPLEIAGSPPRPDAATMRHQQRALDGIVARIRHSTRPVISDDATLLLRAGQALRWEPSIVAELGSAGRYDERRFVGMVQARKFGFFVTDGDRGDLLFDQRFNPAVTAAIHRAYPRVLRVAGRTLHLPPAE